MIKVDLSPSQSKEICAAEAHFFRALRESPHILQIRGGDLKVKQLAFDYIPHSDLEKTLQENPLSTGNIILLSKQALEALAACKQASMVHRDIKPSNGILEDSALFTLIDGGLATSLSPGKRLPGGDLVGTPPYVAPEIWFGLPYDHSIDLWSLGALIFELYVGAPLLPIGESANKNFIFQQIEKTLGPIPAQFFDQSETLQYYAQKEEDGKVVFKEPHAKLDETPWQNRIREAAQRRKDPDAFADRFIDLLSRMLNYDERISIEEALSSPLFSRIFDFHISSPTNLPIPHTLELHTPNSFFIYPLCRRINETCLHLFDDKKGVKGATVEYQLIQHRDNQRKVIEEGRLALQPHQTIQIDLQAPSSKVHV